MSFVLPDWPEAAERGREHFEAGRYFEAHEDWEEIWTGVEGHLRDFYQGLIQLAGAMVKVERREPVGTVRLLRRGLSRLEPLLPVGAPVDVRRLCEAARDLLAEVEAQPEIVAQGRLSEDHRLRLPTRKETGGLRLTTWPSEAQEGVRLYDAGQWWEAHEAFEEAMASAPGDEPLVYKALIQSGAALHKLARGQERPGRVLASKALRLIEWLSPITFPPGSDVDLEAVRATLRWILAETGIPDPVPRPRLCRPSR